VNRELAAFRLTNGPERTLPPSVESGRVWIKKR
jgi:hypothetical protein